MHSKQLITLLMPKMLRTDGYRLTDFRGIVARARKRFDLSDAAIARLLGQEFGFRVSPSGVTRFRIKEGLK